jgi:hypothetical protein
VAICTGLVLIPNYLQAATMAALLRLWAARRLGGSVVQRAEATVAEGRRRLGPRLVHTEEVSSPKSTSNTQASCFSVQIPHRIMDHASSNLIPHS